MTNEKTYLGFVTQANKLNLEVGLGTDYDLITILDAITQGHVSGYPLNVTDVLAFNFASYATLHRKLGFLRKRGFVETQIDDDVDHKTKWLAPTAKTLAHYNELGRILARSAKKSRN